MQMNRTAIHGEELGTKSRTQPRGSGDCAQVLSKRGGAEQGIPGGNGKVERSHKIDAEEIYQGKVLKAVGKLNTTSEGVIGRLNERLPLSEFVNWRSPRNLKGISLINTICRQLPGFSNVLHVPLKH